jgi:putative ATP-dependent endonuclease of the OLD family
LTTHSPHIAAVTPLHSLILIAPIAGSSVARVVPPSLLSPEQTADLERYLNVTRAEILFARHIVLVEGSAETYILPALATAAGFDLDGYGIVVASVEGTDFTPYARLLGAQALDRPFAVLTDGDVTDGTTTFLAEPGLSRALSLLRIRPAAAHETFKERLRDIAAEELPDDGEMRPGRPDLVRQAANAGIYIGEHTLEVDIAPLLADEMTAAFNELVTSQRRQQNFAAAAEAVATGASTAAQQDALLSRIDRIGKGRYAQRLAAHVTVMDLRARITTLLGAYYDAPFDRGHLLEIPGRSPAAARSWHYSMTCAGLFRGCHSCRRTNSTANGADNSKTTPTEATGVPRTTALQRMRRRDAGTHDWMRQIRQRE